MNQDGICRTDLPADVAFYAFLRIYHVFFIRFEGDGLRRTTLGTFGTADAVVGHLIRSEFA